MEEAGFVGQISIDIIRIILLKLPMKSLIRFNSVYKDWYSLIQDQDFQTSYRGRRQRLITWIKGPFLKSLTITDDDAYICIGEEPHRFFSPFDDDDNAGDTEIQTSRLKYLGSCRGLVLVGLESSVYLWNPSTHCSAKVCGFDLLRSFSYSSKYISGLCYDASTNDYKVVVVTDDTLYIVNCRNKQIKVVRFPSYSIRFDGPKCYLGFQDTVHFLAGCDRLMYFDPVCDELRTMSTPEETMKSPIVGLGVVNDCLSIATGRVYDDYVRVFVMREYGVKKSWVSASFSISIDGFRFMPKMFRFYSFNEETLVIIQHGRLHVYNIETSSLYYLPSECGWETEIPVSWAGVYIESLSQPHLVC